MSRSCLYVCTALGRISTESGMELVLVLALVRVILVPVLVLALVRVILMALVREMGMEEQEYYIVQRRLHRCLPSFSPLDTIDNPYI